jgi:hypothetical protein
MSERTFAERIFDGSHAACQVEDRLDEMWPDVVNHTSHDCYDNSLEVYFEKTVASDFKATEEEAKKIFEMGFSRFWLNFTDGTEQAATDAWKSQGLRIGERRLVANPKWSEERAANY